MTTDPLAAATAAIAALVSRKTNPLSTLEAAFAVTEAMSEADARATLQQLIAQRYLCQLDGDIAQLLATRLGVQVQWSHMPLIPSAEWREGRGP